MKKRLPKFATVEEEAAFWEEHSPFEFFKESEFKPLEVRVPEYRPITLHLDSRLRALLEQYADAHHLGPATAVRHIVEERLARFERQQRALKARTPS